VSDTPPDGLPLSSLEGGPVRILDLSTGVAGAYCTKLLADAGADVVKVEEDGGAPLRGWSSTGGQVVGDGALFQFLHTSKRSITGRPGDAEVLRLARLADMVVEDLDPGVLESSALLGIEGLVVVSISPYGRNGPWAGRPSSDFVIQAESGCIAGRGVPNGEPFSVGGRVFDFVGGAYAATAGLAAVMASRRNGRSEHVDVSLQEAAAVASFSGYADLTARLEGVRQEDVSSLNQRVEIPSIEPTADGWVGFTTNSRQQLDDFLLLIDRPELIDDERFVLAKDRWNYFEEWNSIVHAWTRNHPTDEVIDRAVELRIPVAPVATAETVTDYAQFVERKAFLPNPSGGFPQPRCPYLIDGVERPEWGPVPTAGEHNGRIEWASAPHRGEEAAALPLEGVRVLDMTAWFAGPLAAQFFGLLGADVVHLESITRIDGMRATGGALKDRYPDWWEASALFASINTNKRGVTLNLQADQGRAALEKIVQWADVLIENFTPRVMDNFGLTWDVLHALNPQLIMIRMPAFGLDGPWRDWTGFAQTMEQVTGLAWVTGHVDDQPRIQRGPCDIVSGVHAVFSTLVALNVRATRGEGVHVESTMVEAALNAAAEQIVEYGAYGHVMAREGNRSAWAAPQGLYMCRDGRWIALSVETSTQWTSLCTVLQASDWLNDPRLESHAGRRAHQDALDPVLRGWAAERSSTAAVAALIDAGVPAGDVFDQRFLSTHPQLMARRFFEVVDHPVVGHQPVAGPPFRFSSVSRWTTRPAPTLGQDNYELLEAVGMSEAEIKGLGADRVIGERPAGL
jgi:crotonobetainyl-CoA:carnitine CoA-transferase CaiB-like acyl-CoA transferase